MHHRVNRLEVISEMLELHLLFKFLPSIQKCSQLWKMIHKVYATYICWKIIKFKKKYTEPLILPYTCALDHCCIGVLPTLICGTKFSSLTST